MDMGNTTIFDIVLRFIDSEFSNFDSVINLFELAVILSSHCILRKYLLSQLIGLMGH